MNTKLRLNKERGSVIIMTVFIILFISALMITIEVMRLSDLEIITNQVEDMQACYCAEAGVEYGLWLTRRLANWPSMTKSTNLTLGELECVRDQGPVTVDTDWTFQLQIVTSKADPNVNLYNNIHLISTGRTYRFARRVRADVHRTSYGGTTRYCQVRRWRDL